MPNPRHHRLDPKAQARRRAMRAAADAHDAERDRRSLEVETVRTDHDGEPVQVWNWKQGNHDGR